jgi:hypothetical protein
MVFLPSKKRYKCNITATMMVSGFLLAVGDVKKIIFLEPLRI